MVPVLPANGKFCTVTKGLSALMVAVMSCIWWEVDWWLWMVVDGCEDGCRDG